jgi:sugar/nucleoside kinase (ribokinase family)
VVSVTGAGDTHAAAFLLGLTEVRAPVLYMRVYAYMSIMYVCAFLSLTLTVCMWIHGSVRVCVC